MKSKIHELVQDGRSLANEAMRVLNEKFAQAKDHVTQKAFLEELGKQLNEFADKFEDFGNTKN